MSLVPVASESEFLAPGEEKNGPDGTSFHKYCDGKYTNSGSYRMSTLDLLQPRRRQRPSAAAQIEERGRDGLTINFKLIDLSSTVSESGNGRLVTTHRFCGGTCSPPLAVHPFTIEKRAATIENEHVCSFSMVPVCRLHHPFTVENEHICSFLTVTAAHLPPSLPFHDSEDDSNPQPPTPTRWRTASRHQHHLLPSPQVEDATKR
jgi:hypothetical protein